MIRIQFTSFFIMPYRRRYYKRTANKDKYSIEQTLINLPPSTEWQEFPAVPELNIAQTKQFAISVIPPTEIQGTRKVKHFTLTFSGGDGSKPLYYSLIYVPSGYEPQRINIPSSGFAISAYDANQFIISQGVLDFTGGPLRIKSPLSRNLNSGDSIFLVFAFPTTDNFQGLFATVRYAITLQ